MRIRLALLAALAAPIQVHAQRVEVRVDPRVELLSILFHLAGREEYNMTGVPRWTSAISSHFAQYKSHAAMQTTTALATTRRVGFFVPINLAVHIGVPPRLEERAPSGGTTSLHRTWATLPDSTSAYLATLRQFVVDARFDEFLKDQKALIDSTETRMRRLGCVRERRQYWQERRAQRHRYVACTISQPVTQDVRGNALAGALKS